MPNQLNYTTQITTTEYQRPSRIGTADRNLIEEGTEHVLFGTTLKDVVELWVYSPDGSIAGHLNIRPDDDALGLVTVVDNNSEPIELVNLDLKKVIPRLDLNPGRYSIVLNFLRDEVGSEEGYKLFIKDISSDRTEIRVTPLDVSETAVKDIYEFIVPSVPRKFAHGLLSQTFGKSLDATDAEKLTKDLILALLAGISSDTPSRIVGSKAEEAYNNLIDTLLDRTYNRVLDLMAVTSSDLAVQEIELLNYVESAIIQVVTEMKSTKQVDPRFEIF